MFTVSDCAVRVKNTSTGRMVPVGHLKQVTFAFAGETKDLREDGALFAQGMFTRRACTLTLRSDMCLDPSGARDAGQVLLHRAALSASGSCRVSVADAMGQSIEGDFVITREERQDTRDGCALLWQLESVGDPLERAYVALETILVRNALQQFITQLTLSEGEEAALTVQVSPATATNTRVFLMVEDETVSRAEMVSETEIRVTGVSIGTTTLILRALGGVTKEIGLVVTQ